MSYGWGSAVKAQNLLRTSAFGPEAVQVISAAFEAAWAELAISFGDKFEDVDQARIRLAHAVLAAADEGSRDIEDLKSSAIQIMNIIYRRDRTHYHPSALSEHSEPV